MPKSTSLWSQHEQPILWRRAFLAGAAAASLMMGVVDAVSLVGLTPFSFEHYLGSLVLSDPASGNAWTAGVLVNWLIGGVFGFLYAYFFEYVYRRASAGLGLRLGLAHALAASVAFFPFFQLLHEQLGRSPYPEFGFFGTGLGAATPVVLLLAHLFFGVTVGLFYGPVRSARVHARVWEPGESGIPGERGVIGVREDPVDSGFF